METCFVADSTDALSRLAIRERRRQVKGRDGGVDLPPVMVVVRDGDLSLPHFHGREPHGTILAPEMSSSII